MSRPSARSLAFLLAAAFIGATIAATLLAPATATHMPADKVVAKGSTTQVIAPGEEVPILSGSFRSSSPSDLLLSVTLECSIVTQVTTVGNDNAEATGRIVVWVELDGEPIPVGEADDGRVVFCDRAHRQTTSLFDDDEDATIETYLATRTANAFNWATLDVGNGIHVIVVKESLTTETVNDAQAEAVIGKRTLLVDPTKMANDATL
jgi:hypothetical protein